MRRSTIRVKPTGTAMRNQACEIRSPAVTDPKFIDFMKLRLEFVAKGSFEAPSSAIPDALASAA